MLVQRFQESLALRPDASQDQHASWAQVMARGMIQPKPVRPQARAVIHVLDVAPGQPAGEPGALQAVQLHLDLLSVLQLESAGREVPFDELTLVLGPGVQAGGAALLDRKSVV